MISCLFVDRFRRVGNTIHELTLNHAKHLKLPLVIINTAAARARAAWPAVERALKTSGISFDAYQTTVPGDATQRVREALKSGVSTIAVVGGDGTLSEAAEGFFEFDNASELPRPINPTASLAVLPAGTGDDFARGLTNGKRQPLTYWIDKFVKHVQSDKTSETVVDVLFGRSDGFTKPFICLNASTMGIGGETATRVAAQGKFMRRFSGELRFAAAALVGIANWRERRVRISVDGQTTIEGNMNLAAVANALYAGGGMMLSPQARFDDGKLDVVTASGLSRLNVLRELSRIHRGGHVANPKVRIVQGGYVKVETFTDEDAMPIEVDGNVKGFTSVDFRVIPKALRFVR